MRVLRGIKWGGRYFDNKKIELDPDAGQTFDIWAEAERSYCQFRLEFSIATHNGIVEQVIDNEGQPFRVTSLVIDPHAPAGEELNAYEFVYYPDNSPGGWKLIRH